MNYREYQKLKADAEAEFRRKLEAIETVWNLSGGLAPQPAKNGHRPMDSGIVRGELQNAAREAMKWVIGEFTYKDVFGVMKDHDPVFAEKIKDKMPSLSGTLKRMADEKELILVEAGTGKRPSRFRRPG